MDDDAGLPHAAVVGLLDGAALLGLELEPRYRVLAMTIEPAGRRQADDDARVQVLCFPVSELAALLRRTVEGQPRIERFELEQLLAVVERLDAPPIERPSITRDAPDAAWPEQSLLARSDAPDGTRHHLAFSVERDGARLDVRARFDDLRVRRPDGTDVDLGAPDA